MTGVNAPSLMDVDGGILCHSVSTVTRVYSARGRPEVLLAPRMLWQELKIQPACISGEQCHLNDKCHDESVTSVTLALAY